MLDSRVQSVVFIAVGLLFQTGCQLALERHVDADATSGTLVDYDGNAYP
jgi:hypothetical protein